MKFNLFERLRLFRRNFFSFPPFFFLFLISFPFILRISDTQGSLQTSRSLSETKQQKTHPHHYLWLYTLNGKDDKTLILFQIKLQICPNKDHQYRWRCREVLLHFCLRLQLSIKYRNILCMSMEYTQLLMYSYISLWGCTIHPEPRITN